MHKFKDVSLAVIAKKIMAYFIQVSGSVVRQAGAEEHQLYRVELPDDQFIANRKPMNLKILDKFVNIGIGLRC